MQVYIQVYQWNARESMNKPHKNLVYEEVALWNSKEAMNSARQLVIHVEN